MEHIIIFGATGKTGKELVKQALEKEYIVTAFVRNSGKLNTQHKNLSIFEGDVLKTDKVKEAMINQNVVICSLGASGMDKSYLRTRGTKNIIEAMNELQKKRFICQSSLGFADTKEMLPWYMKYIIVPLFLKNAFKDHLTQEKEIEKSNLDWTIIRPANLTNGERTGNYKIGFSTDEKVKLKISRADVAEFMISQVSDNRFIQKKIELSY